MQSEKITAVGLPHYTIDGTGARLVLLHPVGLDLTCFDSLVEELAPSHQVLRVDMRGHGETPAFESPLPQLEDYADDVHNLLRHLDYTPAAVIGFSFGGMIAQELALNHPEDVSALAISACPCSFNQETRLALIERGQSAERGGMASVVDTTMCRWFSAGFRSRGGDKAARQRLLADDVAGWKGAWHAIAGLHTAPRLSRIHVPALCIAGEDDIAAPPPVVKTVANAIPDSRFVVIPDAPHMLFIEAPAAVAAAIRHFLDEAIASG